LRLRTRGVAAWCRGAAPTGRFAESIHEFYQEVIMKTRKLAKPLVAIVLLGLVGVAGAEAYKHQEAAGDSATQAEPKAPADQSMGTWDPRAEMQRIQAQMNRIFEESMQHFRSDQFFQPLPEEKQIAAETKITLQDEQDQYVVKAEIPNTNAKSINVGLDGRLLSISAETRNEQQQSNDQGQVIEQERYVSDFERAFTLPGPVTATGMHSDYHDGVLTVTIPKATS
jgi:HSP20 family protein